MSRVDQIQELLKTNPADSFLNHALALEYVKLQDDAKAKVVFEELLTRDPQYVGSYYHLAKLLERTGEMQAALNIYEQGMKIAGELGERHAYGELRSAYEDLID